MSNVPPADEKESCAEGFVDRNPIFGAAAERWSTPPARNATER
jgi:hypothetical protein